MQALTQRHARLRSRSEPSGVAVAEGSLDEPPDDQQQHPDGDGPDHGLAERLLGQLMQGAAGAGLLAVVPEGELDGEPAISRCTTP